MSADAARRRPRSPASCGPTRRSTRSTPADVERVAAAAELEFHPAGTTIFSQGAEPVEHLRVVRSGAVEIVHDGRVLDLLGEGELFGHASMLSGLPTGFEARAAEDTLCYRIAAEVARELLAGPAALRFVARSLLEPPAESRASGARAGARPGATSRSASLLRGDAGRLRARHVDPRGGAADDRRAARPRSSSTLGDGALGILTDRDLRTRVVAAGLLGDAPVSAAMSAPAYTCRPDRLGGDVLLEMLDRGFRHFPVVSATGRGPRGVEDLDLVAVRDAVARSSCASGSRARRQRRRAGRARRASCARW